MSQVERFVEKTGDNKDLLGSYLNAVKLLGGSNVGVRREFKGTEKNRAELEATGKVYLCAGKLGYGGETNILAVGGSKDQRDAALTLLHAVLTHDEVSSMRKPESVVVYFRRAFKHHNCRVVSARG